jgi:ATP-dependent DNA helicase RecQ
VLAGNNALVVMPTGSGKSLIYQLAGLMMEGTALVFSPLIALMKDQVDGMTRRGIPATYINSSLDLNEQGRRVRALVNGEYKLMLVAPERLRSPNFRAALRQTKISMMAIDEAHCLSQWGHDFRPDYLHIAQARQQLQPHVTLALTATATPRAQGDIMDLLGLPDAVRFINGFNRPNIFFQVLPAPDPKTKLARVRDFLRSPAAEGAGLIYAGTRREAEEMSAFIKEMVGLPVRHYHAGLDAPTRAEVQDAFLSGDLPLVVATNAFGMGIDRPDVRFVLHVNMPGSLEAYYQEAGRAGRDGLPARATLLYATRDAMLQEHFIETSSPTEEQMRQVHRAMQSDEGVSSDDIVQHTGLKETVVRVAVEQLASVSGDMNGDAMRQIMDMAERRKDHKRALLRTMIQYAQTEDCRRRFMLAYFGDEDAAKIDPCCDNCTQLKSADTPSAQTRKAETQAERAALIVLDTVALLAQRGQGVGKGKLAQILRGSEAEEMMRYKANRNFAKFAALRVAEVESLISQLISAGYLKQSGDERPTLQLSRRGEATLSARAAVDVTLRPVTPKQTETARVRTSEHTIEITRRMLGQGLSVERVAAERTLALSTIYSHCAQLIAEGLLSVDAVVPKPQQALIRAAIEQVGSAVALSPIKAVLPAEVEYNVIRCVAEDWKRERGEGKEAAAPEAAAIEPSPEELQRMTQLFGKLREWRTGKAREASVPPYVIFSDEALRCIAQARPATREALLAVRGVGQVKLERYGDEVLGIVGGS